MNAIATIPIGRLMKNAQCQPNVSVMKPPSSGPTTDDSPNAAPKIPWYFPRSAGANRSATTANALVNSPADPAPWIARNAISCVAVRDTPHDSDPPRNTPIATSRIRLRPYRSDSFP